MFPQRKFREDFLSIFFRFFPLANQIILSACKRWHEGSMLGLCETHSEKYEEMDRVTSLFDRWRAEAQTPCDRLAVGLVSQTPWVVAAAAADGIRPADVCFPARNRSPLTMRCSRCRPRRFPVRRPVLVNSSSSSSAGEEDDITKRPLLRTRFLARKQRTPLKPSWTTLKLKFY